MNKEVMPICRQGNTARVRYAFLSAMLSALFAKPVLAADVPTTPQEAEDQFSRAMSLRDGGELGESIRLMRGMLAQEPKDRVKLELAVAYYRALNFDKARSLAEEVLNQPATPESVKVTIRQFLAQVEADSKPSAFSPFVSFGYVSDSNANAGPARSTLDIGGSSFNLGSSSLKKGDSGFNAMVGVNHRYLLGKTLQVGNSEAAALWQSQLSYYAMSYDSIKAQDLDVVSLSTGPALISTDNWRVSVPYQYSDIYRGHGRLATFQGLDPTVVWKLSGWELSADFQYQDKTFQQPQDSGRNSELNSVGLGAGRAFADGRYAISFTVRGFKEAAVENRFSNHGDDLGGALIARPWAGWEFSLRHNYRSSDYSGQEPVYGIARHDNEARSSFAANYVFREGALNNWTLGLATTVTRNRSNVSIYDYSRIQTGLTLSRAF